MNSIKIIGGLGNQMFQYATAFAVAKNNNENLTVDISSALAYTTHPLRLNYLSCSYPFATKSSLYEKLCLYPKFNFLRKYTLPNYYIEKDLSFDNEIFKVAQGKKLIGYFQSEKYFSAYKNEIRNEFKPKNDFNNYQKELIKEMATGTSIAVHIRRGDYISEASANNTHGVCNSDYFTNALNYLTKSIEIIDEIKIYIFSDDILWCKDNIEFPYEQCFIDDDINNPELDLWVMAHCNHHIISNSSFSWWGAWLCIKDGQKVVAPKDWFADEKLNSTDIVCNHWAKL